MHRTYSSRQSWLALLSLTGLVAFAGLYFESMTLYPGGSNVNPAAEGFDWLTNYWCDLLAEQAKNGRPNPAAPVAMLAMGVLCLSLIIFWIILPTLLRTQAGAPERRDSRPTRWLIQYPGVTAILIAPFIASAYHDAAINVASTLVTLPLCFTIWGLYKTRQCRLFWLGTLCGSLMLVNQLIYQTGWFLTVLPVVQKITFALVLIWLSMLNWQIYQTSAPAQTHP